jgi:hypothetical protein
MLAVPLWGSPGLRAGERPDETSELHAALPCSGQASCLP